MRTIQVTKEQLDKMIDQIENDGDYTDGKFETANELGFEGFAGGLDHTQSDEWTLKIIDRGMSSGSYVHDNSVKFVVPLNDRK